MTGRLVLIGTPIGNLGDITDRARQTFKEIDVLLCEDTRQTRKLLGLIGVDTPRLIAVHQHTEASFADKLVEFLGKGLSVGFVSDAGMPVMSDPGAQLVNIALEAGFEVDVVPGPSSASAALALCGFAGSEFYFAGFLPRKGKLRRAKLKFLTTLDCRVVIFEAPNRVERTLSDLADVGTDDRQIALIREITKLHQQVLRGTTPELLDKLPEPIKGEIVLVLDEHIIPSEVDEESIVRALKLALASNQSGKDAVNEVSESLQVGKNLVYDLYKSL